MTEADGAVGTRTRGRRPAAGSASRAAQGRSRALGTGAKTTGRALAAVGARDRPRRAVHPAPGAPRRGAPRAPDSSGLSRLIELHAFNAAGDAAVAISLAGTLFFQVPTGEARGQVALFLGLTMLPFAIVAPLIGPFLDRFSHGRRWAIGATMAVRAFLVLGAGDRGHDRVDLALPRSRWAAWSSSKAYGVTRAAAVPRLLPGGPHPRQGQRPHLPGRHGRAPASRRRSPAWRRCSARSGRCATRSCCSCWPPSGRSGCPRGSTPTPARTRPCSSARPARARAARGCGSRARCPSPCGPTAARAGSRASCTMFMAFLLRENPIGDWAPEVLLGILIGAAGLRQRHRHRARVGPRRSSTPRSPWCWPCWPTR